jgi:hypothetical protein
MLQRDPERMLTERLRLGYKKPLRGLWDLRRSEEALRPQCQLHRSLSFDPFGQWQHERHAFHMTNPKSDAITVPIPN